MIRSACREDGLEFRLGHAELVLPVAWITQHLGVDAQRDVVDKQTTVDTAHVHAPFVLTGGENVESAQGPDDVKPEIAREVVEGARGHHHDG